MAKKMSKFLNIITFGYLGRKAKKEAAKQTQTKNNTLTVNTVGLPDIDALINNIGGVANINDVSATISTISFQLKDVNNINLNALKQIAIKGVIKSENNITLIIGDCALVLKDKILNKKNNK